MATNEPLLTRYLIYETEDVDGETLKRVGEALAKGSDDALRKWFADPPIDRAGFYVAISENARRIRRVQAKVKTTIGEAAPAAPLPGPESLV